MEIREKSITGPGTFSGSVVGGWNTDASGELYIGRRTQVSAGKNFFDGLVDELSFYDRQLDPTEIFAVFSAGSDGKCKGPSDEPIFGDGFEVGDTPEWSATVQ